MSMKNVRNAILSILFAASAAGAFSQSSGDLHSRALEAYEKESFEKAFALVSESVPEDSKNAALKKQASDALTAVSVREHDERNYKNAYDGFRKALKYDPSNARATQYFLKMRKEMNTANLRNEGSPRTAAAPAPAAPPPAAAVAPTAAAPAPAPASGTAGAPAAPEQPPASAQSAPAAAPPAKSDIELEELKNALLEAERRMRAMETTVAGTSKENETLKDQTEKQLKLLQTFMESQSQKSAAPAPTAKQSAQEQAMVAQTMALLAKIADREEAAPQVVVQSDPELKNLVQRIDEQQRSLQTRDSRNLVLIVAVIVVGVAVLAIAALFIALALRARGRGRRTEGPRYAPEGDAGAAFQLSYRAPAAPSGGTPLLEFIGASQTALAKGEDFDIRKDLLRAERLNRMYEEVRAGSLSWNTVRDYIGELDVALKTDILKVVERKLNEGDLLSSEAILPVIFPFLTDYDDFIREKSERLAQRALLEHDGDAGALPQAGRKDNDPLSLKSLVLIPKELKALFKNQDQSIVTAKLCRGVGSVLGLSTEDCNLLYKTALAHDCGYLMMDRDRLQQTIAKPEITEDDFAFIQTHVALGPTYFDGIDLPVQFREGLLCHHERNDGSGYPNGLRKDEIPLFAKIIGVSETLAALVAKRAYREKRNIQNALAIISDGSRTKFDANIVAALEKVATSLGRL